MDATNGVGAAMVASADDIPTSGDLDTIVSERAGVLTHARRKCVEIDGLTQRGRMTAEDAGRAKDILRAFADEIAQGLHVETADTAPARVMRQMVKDAAQ